MKKAVCLALCLFWVSWVAVSCGGTENATYAGVLRGNFCAEVQGVLNGTDFSARVEAREGEAGREVVVTFYAPNEIYGTEAVKRADGSGYLKAGTVLLEGGESGMAPFFDLFLSEPIVEDVVLNESGHTEVRAKGTVLTLLPDGTPYRLTASTAELTVISWEAH